MILRIAAKFRILCKRSLPATILQFKSKNSYNKNRSGFTASSGFILQEGLFVVEIIVLIRCFARHVDAKAFEYAVVYRAEDYAGVQITAAQLVQLLHGAHRVFVGRRADGERHQHLIGVQARVSALHVVGFQRLNRCNDRRRDELHLVRNACKHLQSVQCQRRGSTQQFRCAPRHNRAVRQL